MEGCKIIDYSEEWRSRLSEYMKKTFPEYSDSYIDYCMGCSSGSIPSKIVVTDKGEVVGCHLYYCTKVCINGEVYDTQWGHNTFLNEEFRPIIGLDLMLLTQSIKGFGLGLTEHNERIQKKLKKVFFDGTYNYYVVTRKILLSPIQKLFHNKPQLSQKEIIKEGKYEYRLIHDVNDIRIPNDGFWFKGYRDIDFIRDAAFLRKRFFDNNVFPYQVYSLKSNENAAYFVVRQTLYRGYNALTLCDFRYSHNDEQTLKSIMRAVKKIANLSNIGIILFVCGDVNMEKALKNTIHHKTKMDFVSGMKVRSDMSYCITGADSDADFLKL